VLGEVKAAGGVVPEEDGEETSPIEIAKRMTGVR